MRVYLPLLVMMLLAGMLTYTIAQEQRDQRTWLLIAYLGTGLVHSVAELIRDTSTISDIVAVSAIVAQLALGIVQLPALADGVARTALRTAR